VATARKVWQVLLVTVEIEAVQERLKRNCQCVVCCVGHALLDLFASTFCSDRQRLNVRCGSSEDAIERWVTIPENELL
jgi:hypothetical protein